MIQPTAHLVPTVSVKPGCGVGYMLTSKPTFQYLLFVAVCPPASVSAPQEQEFSPVPGTYTEPGTEEVITFLINERIVS